MRQMISEIEKQFFADAEAEGYPYGDGKPLEERELQFCMALTIIP